MNEVKRWNVFDNEPDLVGKDCTIRVDGEEIPKVRQFDVEEGWVRALCMDDHTGHGGEPHLCENEDHDSDPALCEVWYRGEVEVEVPEGVLA